MKEERENNGIARIKHGGEWKGSKCTGCSTGRDS